ncbi:NAD-dependent epimerase/dehydratase family protein [Prauserella alba]|uniref:NAD-dependent epimerase/dehydratase family protein n=1 Tax=Prauserella alba TaxID=176898 RepID=A0ABP4G4C8_9PSEU|nr:NAD-dependent epimerase/dehydratase family protein [Prauserella alba]MCP2181983.1 Nucleoside-diphosphate-sugar epimerase [Prauserella alba]
MPGNEPPAPSGSPRSAPTAVLAGCGDLGTRVAVRLAGEGYRVLGLRRRPERLPAAVEGQAVDLRTEQPRLPREMGVVVVALTADDRTAEAYRDTYVNGVANVLAAIDRDVPGRPRVLLVSSTAVYGAGDGSLVDERTPVEPDTATGLQLRAAERRLHEWRPDAIVLRLAGLYGPGPGRLVASVRDGTATVDSRPVYTNRIHRDDAADAIVHLTDRVDRPDPLYVGVDHEPAERGAVLRFVAGELGVAPPPTGDEPSARGTGKRCDCSRLRASGYTFTYPTYREGYRAACEGSR